MLETNALDFSFPRNSHHKYSNITNRETKVPYAAPTFHTLEIQTFQKSRHSLKQCLQYYLQV